MPGKQELPSTLERSSKKAQRTWIKAHDAAVEEDRRRSARTVVRRAPHGLRRPVGSCDEPVQRRVGDDVDTALVGDQPTAHLLVEVDHPDHDEEH